MQLKKSLLVLLLFYYDITDIYLIHQNKRPHIAVRSFNVITFNN